MKKRGSAYPFEIINQSAAPMAARITMPTTAIPFWAHFPQNDFVTVMDKTSTEARDDIHPAAVETVAGVLKKRWAAAPAIVAITADEIDILSRNDVKGFFIPHAYNPLRNSCNSNCGWSGFASLLARNDGVRMSLQVRGVPPMAEGSGNSVTIEAMTARVSSRAMKWRGDPVTTVTVDLFRYYRMSG